MDYLEIEIELGNAKCRLILDACADKPANSPPHAHTNFELFYVWSGEVDIQTEKERFRVGEGQAVLIAPACYHDSFTQPGTEKINLYFSFVRSGKHSNRRDVYAELTRVFLGRPVTVMERSEGLGSRISALRKSWSKEVFCSEERLKGELTGLLFAVYDALEKRAVSPAADLLPQKAGMQYRYEIDALLAQNYAQDIDLSFLADSLYLSPKRVAVLIKSLYGKSFRCVKAEMKIQVAKQMLKETKMSVAAIAAHVGYRSTRGFLTAFVQMTGMTPTQYRERHGVKKTL